MKIKNIFENKIIKVALGIFLVTASFYAGIYVNAKNLLPTIHNLPSGYAPASILNKDESKNAKVDFGDFWKVWKLLDQKFVYTGTSTDSGVVVRERVYGAIKGMTDSLGDPYTVFLTPEENIDLETELSGSLEGVGMEVGMKEGLIVVVAPLKNSPAEKAGVLAGDTIVKIGDKSTEGLNVMSAVKLIRGKKGTSVTITFVRNGEKEPVITTIIRDVINIPIVETEFNKTEKTFIIKVNSFSSNVAELFRVALKDFVFSGEKKLIIDLRNNPGGYLDASVDMASWFLPRGKVVVIEDFGGVKKNDDYRSAGYDIFKNSNIKIVILINGGSASASEILAGALREYKIATLVGETTFGKGSVQELVPISDDGAALKVTIARWLTPMGISISKAGLKPDFEVKMTAEDIKAKKDPQLLKAFEVLNQL